MEVIILCKVVLWNEVACVPIQTDVIDELNVLITKEEAILPVLLVLISYFLFDLV